MLRMTWQIGRPLAVVALLASLTACASIDRHVFRSTVMEPMTVSLYEPKTDHVIWKMAIPVQHELVVDLDRAGEIEWFRVSGKPATVMHWKLYHSDMPGFLAAADKQGKVDLPGRPVMLKVTLRPAPEYPPGQTPPGSEPPASETATPANGG